MDPTACFQRCLNAINEYDWQGLDDALSDLKGWLDRGGFPPSQFDSFGKHAAMMVRIVIRGMKDLGDVC